MCVADDYSLPKMAAPPPWRASKQAYICRISRDKTSFNPRRLRRAPASLSVGTPSPDMTDQSTHGNRQRDKQPECSDHVPIHQRACIALQLPNSSHRRPASANMDALSSSPGHNPRGRPGAESALTTGRFLPPVARPDWAHMIGGGKSDCSHRGFAGLSGF